jgi:5-methylcytosine-specific restriction protein A
LRVKAVIPIGKIRGARICPTHGCPNDMPCDEHKPKAWATSTRRERLPSNWSSIVRFIKRRDKGQCQWPGCQAKGTEVDHVIPNDDDDLTNLWLLCTDHHKAKTQSEAAQARRDRNA